MNIYNFLCFHVRSGAENRDSGLYYVTHMRLTPWLIGFATGYVLQYGFDKKIKINKVYINLKNIKKISFFFKTINYIIRPSW